MGRTMGRRLLVAIAAMLILAGNLVPSQAQEVRTDLPATIFPADGPAIPPAGAEEPSGGGAPPIGSAGAHRYLVPTSGHLPGSGGTFWVTDVVVHNPGPSNATVNIYFMKEKQDNSGAAGQVFSILAGRSLKLKDVVEDTFGQSSTSGALLIGSSVPLLVASRTFNDQPAGTFGQYVPGQPEATLVTGTNPARLVQLTKNAVYRTNIGFANMTANATPVTVTLYRSTGALAGAYAEVVDPWGYKQINDVFTKANAGTADDAYAVVTSSLAGARYFTYASVIDGRTGDPVTVIPVAAASAAVAKAAQAPVPETPDASTVTVFSDTFEGSFPPPNWSLSFVYGQSNRSVNWGRSSYRKAGGSYSVWCVGSGSGAPAPGGQYPPNMGAWMQYGPFSLADATSAKAELDLWLTKQTGKDVFGVWGATSATGQYSSVYVDPSNTGGAWRHETVPLNDFAGAPQVWLAITFTSDGSTQYEGAYVDNLVISKTVACAAPPVPAAAAPPTAASGATYTVNWSATSPENRYEIQEADNASFTGAATFAVATTSRSFTHTVAAATTYYYRVRALACSPTLQSAWSGTVQTLVSPGCSSPAAPALTAPASAASGAGYNVIWTATSPDGTYEIEEATSSSFSGASHVAVSGTSRAYTHTVASATTYYYRVRATVSCGSPASAWSSTGQTQVTPSGPSTSGAVYVPGAAALSGSGGTNWRTDLEVHNPGGATATYEIALLKRDQDNPNPPKASFTLDGGLSMRYGNVLSNLFGFSGAATLRVSPTAGEIMVTSRTYDDQIGGTYGQFVAGRPASRAIEYGGAGRLLLLSQAANLTYGFRTNVGLVNVTGLTITVEVEVHYGDGNGIGTKQYSLGPYKSIQVNELIKSELGTSEVDDGYAIVRTTTPGGAFFAYASVIDNRSKDPIYVPAEVVQ